MVGADEGGHVDETLLAERLFSLTVQRLVDAVGAAQLPREMSGDLLVLAQLVGSPSHRLPTRRSFPALPRSLGAVPYRVGRPHSEPTPLQDASPTTNPLLLGRTGKTCFG